MTSQLPSPPPERANLEQLKKQAKSLLHAARAGESLALGRFRLLPAFARRSVAELGAAGLALHDAQSVIAREHGFDSWNMHISIDDFGTGYSSMSALSTLPTDALKIDRAFVLDCANQATSRSVVESIISIAHVLGKVTVAEGVETPAQVRTLRQLGCDFAQGYLFSRPVAAQDLFAVAIRATAWRTIVDDSPRERLRSVTR